MPAAPDRSLPALVALLTLVTLELVRSSGPLLDRAYSGGGVGSVTRAALLTYAAPGAVAALLLLVLGRRIRIPASWVLGPGMLLLAALRLLLQGLEGTARAAVGLATVGIAVWVLTLAVALFAGRTDGGRTAAAAVAVGAAGGVGLQLALGSWDAYWRHTVLGWSVTAALVAALVALGVAVLRSGPTDRLLGVPRLWALGPFLALAAMMLANPAFAASQSGAPLAVAGALQALGLLLAGGLALRSDRIAGPLWSGIAAAVLAALVIVALTLYGGRGRGTLVLLALIGAQLLGVRALGHALGEGGRHRGNLSLASTSGWAPVVGLLTIVPLLAYQVDYDLPLGFPNQLVLAATAVALGAAGVVRTGEVPASGTRSARLPLPLWAAAGALVLVGGVVAGTAWLGQSKYPARPNTGRVLTWNLHYGVSPGGSVDLEQTALAIEAQDPDVVLLQEVSRGWVLGGGVDMATWLAHRLDRRFVFAPAADGRFGNVILARDEPTEVLVLPLPYGDGPQHRSAISARVRVADRSVPVTSVHLQQRVQNTPTRLLELQTLLTATNQRRRDAPAQIVGGDLNATPGSAELRLLEQAGYVSALDSTGQAAALTSPSINPVRRIDWLLGRGLTFSQAGVLTDARTSDHLAVVATLEP